MPSSRPIAPSAASTTAPRCGRGCWPSWPTRLATGAPPLLAGERRAALLAAVERLPERDRLVIACRYFLELDEAETAAALDCRRGTVKSRLSRALERLRAELEQRP